jgi:hypothetical protein
MTTDMSCSMIRFSGTVSPTEGSHILEVTQKTRLRRGEGLLTGALTDDEHFLPLPNFLGGKLFVKSHARLDIGLFCLHAAARITNPSSIEAGIPISRIPSPSQGYLVPVLKMQRLIAGVDRPSRHAHQPPARQAHKEP